MRPSLAEMASALLDWRAREIAAAIDAYDAHRAEEIRRETAKEFLDRAMKAPEPPQ